MGTIVRVDVSSEISLFFFRIDAVTIGARCWLLKERKARDFSAIIRNYDHDQFGDSKKCGNRRATRRYRGDVV